jgi:multidrug efflux pump subunit AcrB
MAYQNYNQGPPPPHYGQQTSSLAVISLISGIASFFIVPLLGAIAAIITGGMAKKEIRQSGGRISGGGMATWGTLLGWLNIALSLIAVCLFVLGFLGIVTLPFCIIPFTNGF